MVDTTKGKAHGCDPVSFQNDTTNTAIIAPDRARIKLEATAIAEFALRGYLVHKGPCGDFSVIRWGLARYCQDLEALHAFAVQTGVAS